MIPAYPVDFLLLLTFFKGDWIEITKGRMTTIGAVKRLNILKHGRAGSLSGGESIAIELFNRERMEERFRCCMVITAACSPPALNDLMIDIKRF